MSLRLGTNEFATVRNSAMFAGLTQDIAQDVLSDTAIEVHEAESVIFHQGDEAHAFFVVLDGWVKLSRVMPSGLETVIGTFTRGQTFGEAIALAGGIFPAFGIAVTTTRVIRVRSDRLRRRIFEQPEIGLAMIASTAQHLQLLVRQIEQLKSLKGAERVAEFLLSLTDAERGPVTIALPFDKTLIAGRLGMKPESLSRAFARLKATGVKVNGAKVTIDDVAYLRVCMLEAETLEDA
jgi:CRP-like cAMP-binding protein